MSERKISVIVPVYGIEQYISKCIESIVNQSYKNLEIILVDDGSPDNCGVICDDWGKIDSRIIVVHKENGGLSDARNAGIDIATGDILGFVDGDDYIAPHFFETLMKLMTKYNSLIAECGNVKFLDGDENPIFKNQEKISVISAYEWFTETNLGDFLSCTVWNKIYDRNLFQDIRFPVGRIYEDTATTYKIVYKAGAIVRTYEKLYFYRQRKNSIVNSQMTLKKFEHEKLNFTERVEFLENKGEYKLSKFTKSKYCISLCFGFKSICKLYDKNMKKKVKKQIRNEIKEYYYSFLNDAVVPIKYKLFIAFFIITSFFY